MGLAEIIAGCFSGIIAIVLLVYVSFTARCKGPILSNSYLWLSKEEREKVDKKAEYKLLTIVFGLLTVIFTLLTIYIFTSWKWAHILMWILCGVVIVYAICDSIKTAIKK